MSAITFYQYPALLKENNHTFSSDSTAASVVDDPHDAPDDFAGNAHFYAQNGVVHTGSVYYSLTAPNTGVTINWIKVWVRHGKGTVGPNQWSADPVVDISVKPNGGGASPGSNITISNHYNYNTQSWGGGDWLVSSRQLTTNPASGSAWTVSDLQNLWIGMHWDNGGTSLPGAGGNAPRYFFTQIYVEANANTTAQSTEVERGKGSAFLREFRRPIRVLDVDLPPSFADVDVMTNVALSHFAAPVSAVAALGGMPMRDGSRAGAGIAEWRRRDIVLLNAQVSPDTGILKAKFMDAREFRCGLWSPLYNTLTIGEGGEGTAILDSGAGRIITRNRKRYPERIGTAPAQRIEISANKEMWDRRGLHVEGGGETQSHLRNAFDSSWATSWTIFNPAPATGGGISKGDDFLFDVAGFRNALQISQGAGPLQAVGPYQAVSINGTNFPYAQVNLAAVCKTAPTAGDGKLYWRLLNTTDTTTWNETTQTWDAGSGNGSQIPGSDVAGWRGSFSSRPIPLVAGAKTYQLGIFAGGATGGGSNAVHYIHYLDMSYSATRRDVVAAKAVYPIVATPVAQVPDSIAFSNGVSVRFWDPNQGTFIVKVAPEWGHVDMADGELRYVWDIRHATSPGTYRDEIYYKRTNSTTGAWEHKRTVNGSAYTSSLATSGGTLPVRGTTYKIASRWSSILGELTGTAYQLKIQVDGTDGSLATPAAAMISDSDVKGYLGSTLTPDQHFDGYFRDLEIDPFVLTDEEVSRRHGG